MPLASFRKLCVDAVDPVVLGTFWSEVLDRPFRSSADIAAASGRPGADGPDDGEGGLFGRTQGHTVWFNKVAEPRSVKHRVHLDVYATDLACLQALGATVVLGEGDDRHWTVMADPEGGEFCAFLRPDVPAERLHGLVVDSVDPMAQAQWWGEVLGGDVVHDERGFSTVEHVPGLPILTMDFVPVPEPKVVKNRIHPDLAVPDVDALLAAGATLLRARDEEIRWHVLADPEGNEFCAFGG